MRVRVSFFVVVLMVVGVLSMALGPYMHESDQASLLFGGVRLASGKDSPFDANFYNYDKQYATYWLVALAHRLLPKVDLISLGNALSFCTFWGGLAVFLWGARIRRALVAAGLGTCMLAPSLLMHSPYLATAFVAGGFVFLGAALWRLAHGRVSLRVGAIACLALAVGCRADTVLILPLIAWLATPASSLRRLLARPWPYAVAAIGVAALVLGRLIFKGSGVEFFSPFFYPKIFVVFVVFGMGGAVLVLPVCLAALGGVAWRRWRQRRATWLFYGLGIAGLLLPFAYYFFQLFSPRYWVVGVCGMILLLASRRGDRLLFLPWRGVRAATGLLWGAAAILPLFVGLHMSGLTKIQPVLTHPTTFPTADGLMPMGATAWQLLHQRKSPDGIVDHNQATWVAAKATDFHAGADGAVPLLLSPLRTYLQLAVELQGKESRDVTADEPFYYTELRRIVRSANVFTAAADAEGGELLRRTGFVRVSPLVGGGYAILIGRAGTTNEPEIQRALALAALFGGREYVFADAAEPEPLESQATAGKTAVLFSDRPFAVELAGAGEARRLESQPVESLGQALVLDPVTRGKSRLTVQGENVRCAVASLPDFMSGGL